jgi:peptidoglycan/LPS O-acetylase OafA/YrhL
VDNFAVDDQLRDQQRRLAAALDKIDDIAVDSDGYDLAFAEVDTLVLRVVAHQRAIPLRQHQQQHDHYAARIRVLGIVLAAAAAFATVAIVIGWMSSWLLLLTLPLLGVAALLAITAAGDRDQVLHGFTPEDRYLIGIIGLIAIVFVLTTGLVSWWGLIGAIPATGLTIVSLAVGTTPLGASDD